MNQKIAIEYNTLTDTGYELKKYDIDEIVKIRNNLRKYRSVRMSVVESKYRDIQIIRMMDIDTKEQKIECHKISRLYYGENKRYIIYEEKWDNCDIQCFPPTIDQLCEKYDQTTYYLDKATTIQIKNIGNNKYLIFIRSDQLNDKLLEDISDIMMNNFSKNYK